MYNVKSGEQYAKITITDAETVKFSDKWDVFGVKGDDITVKLNSTDTGDGVYNTDDTGGAVIIAHGRRLDTMYLTGTGDVIVWAGASAVDCPFKSGAKGGGGSGGDNTHYKGTTTTAIENGSTTNPITIDGEEYTAVFGDIVVYGYTEFVFDGTQWSEFGRPFDTTPTSGSANAVTSDGIYRATPSRRGTGSESAIFGSPSNKATATNSIAEGSYTTASGQRSHAGGSDSTASGLNSFAYGQQLQSTQENQAAFGTFNQTHTGDLFNIGNGTAGSNRSNIVEVNSTELNVNGEIKKNGVSLPTPYTTMPAITAATLGQIAMYVGETTNDYVKGYFYIASSDGAAEPTYSWASMVDNAPTSGSNNFVTSDGVYNRTPMARGGTGTSAVGTSSSVGNSGYSFAFGSNASATANFSTAIGNGANSSQAYCTAIGRGVVASKSSQSAFGKFNSPKNNTIFEVGCGSDNNHRANILEATTTSVNVNGNIQRDGVGIDDYTTTERKIGKWIDGSDLYQRTFEVTGLLNDNQWHTNPLGTSGIEIVDFSGYVDFSSDGSFADRQPLNMWIANDNHINVDSIKSDLEYRITRPDLTVEQAVITIKYTKPSAQANLMQTAPTEEVSETPTVEEDDMR